MSLEEWIQMRMTILTRIFFLLGLVLVGTLLASYWKSNQILKDQQRVFFEEQSSKIATSVSRLTSDRVRYLQSELQRFANARESNSKVKDIPTGWWGQFYFVAQVDRGPHGEWGTKWLETSSGSPAAHWPQGTAIRMIEEIPFHDIRENQKHFQKISDPQKQSLFAIAFQVPELHSTSTPRFIVGVLPALSFADLVNEYKGSANTVMVVDQRGIALSHSSSSLIASSFEKNPMVDEVLTTGTLTRSRYQEGSDPQLASHDLVPQTNLAVITFAPDKSGVAKLRSGFMIIGFALILLVVGFSIHFSKWFTSPMLRLKEAIQTAQQTGRLEIDPNEFGFAEAQDLAESMAVYKSELDRRFEEQNQAREVQLKEDRRAAVRRLAAGIATELKHPLIGLLGHSQLAKDKAGGREELKKHFDAIEKEARKTKNMIENLMKFSGTEKPELVSTNFNEVVQAAISQVELLLTSKGITLHQQLAPVSRVMANSSQLKQALMSLMLYQGKTLAKTPRKELSVSLFERDNDVVLQLEDTGEGLSEEWKESAFEPSFSQFDDEGAASFELAGVGGVIYIHGGKIQLTSVIGQGNSYTIALPKTAQTNVGAPAVKISGSPTLSSSANSESLAAKPIPGITEAKPLPTFETPAPVAKILKSESPLAPQTHEMDKQSLDDLLNQLAELEKVALDKSIAAHPKDLNFEEKSSGQSEESGSGEKEEFSFGLPSIPPQLVAQQVSPKLPPKPSEDEEDFKVHVRKPRLRI